MTEMCVTSQTPKGKSQWFISEIWVNSANQRVSTLRCRGGQGGQGKRESKSCWPLRNIRHLLRQFLKDKCLEQNVHL